MKMEKWAHANVAAREHSAESNVRTHMDEQGELRHQTTQLLQTLRGKKREKILIQQRPSAQKTFRCVTAGRAHVVNDQIKEG